MCGSQICDKASNRIRLYKIKAKYYCSVWDSLCFESIKTYSSAGNESFCCKWYASVKFNALFFALVSGHIVMAGNGIFRIDSVLSDRLTITGPSFQRVRICSSKLKHMNNDIISMDAQNSRSNMWFPLFVKCRMPWIDVFLPKSATIAVLIYEKVV